MISSDRPPLLFLVGFMGAGKSTLGRLLAMRLGWTFLNLDCEIERQRGESIAQIFEKQGEPAFRKLEAAALESALQNLRSPTVIALGGGALTQAANVQGIRQSGGKTIWVEAPLEELWQRCQNAPEGLRPLARDRSAFERLYKQRKKSYEAADYHLHSGGRGPEELVEELKEWLERDQRQPEK